LIEAAGLPIAAPSANRFGRVSPTRVEHVVAQLAGRVAIVLDGGPCRVGIESTVIRLADGRAELLRPGGLAAEAIEAVIGPLAPIGDGPMTASLSPGRSPSHYAPSVPVTLVGPVEGAEARPNERIGLLAADDRGRAAAVTRGGPYAQVEVLSAAGDRVEQAANLFDALHRLDAGGVDRIVAQSVPTDGLGRAIMDRLVRAATT
jgi:L-threonylcarbamoyladenylate synthase